MRNRGSELRSAGKVATMMQIKMPVARLLRQCRSGGGKEIERDGGPTKGRRRNLLRCLVAEEGYWKGEGFWRIGFTL